MVLQDRPSPTAICIDGSVGGLWCDLLAMVSLLELTTAVRYGAWCDLEQTVEEIDDCLVSGYLTYMRQRGRLEGQDPLMWVFDDAAVFSPVKSAFAYADLMLLTVGDHLPKPLPGWVG